jgi:zinc transport system substrate-binding protein
LLLASGCSGPATNEVAPQPTSGEDGVLSVYVVNYPLEYFAKRIGRDRVMVTSPAPAGEDPAFWSPDAEAVLAYQGADLILLSGAGYAKWVEVATLPRSKLVNTSAAFEDRLIRVESDLTHSHGPEGEHSHGETAFTVWLDLGLAVEQARAITEALAAARPEHAAVFEEGFSSLERDLLAVDAELAELAAEGRDRAVLGSHPVYQYLARRHELDLASVHFEPDEFPDEAAWSGLEALLNEHHAGWMLWEGEPLAEIASRLQDAGVESAVFDPCGNRPSEGDFLTVMRSNVDNLRPVLNGE